MNMKPNPSTVDTCLAMGRTLPKKNGCKFFLLFYYTFVTLVAIGLILMGHIAWLKEQQENKTEDHHRNNHNFSMRFVSFSFTKLKPTAAESYLSHSGEEIWDSSLRQNKQAYTIVAFVQSNPYNLNAKQIAQQFRSAKIFALKNRVKRFACWHSCFGQFRKKAIRTLYGSSIQLFTPSITPTVEKQRAADNNLRKRQTEIEATITVPQRESDNNELGEGDNRINLQLGKPTQEDVNTQLKNPTAFFKLKTNQVARDNAQDVRADEQETSSPKTSFIDQDGQKVENSLKNNNEGITSTTLKTGSFVEESKQMKVSDSSFSESDEDLELGPSEENEESGSPEEEYVETSGSEESEEDKRDEAGKNGSS